jgi:hypothetical protein
VILADQIIRSVDESGRPSASWVRMKLGCTIGHREAFIDEGMAAMKALPAGSAARSEVARWVAAASKSWPIAPGTYSLGRGKAAIVIEEATPSKLAEARARAQVIGEENRLMAVPKRVAIKSPPRKSASSDAEIRRRARAALALERARAELAGSSGRMTVAQARAKVRAAGLIK